jgi:hypothetical protein
MGNQNKLYRNKIKCLLDKLKKIKLMEIFKHCVPRIFF